MGVWHTDLTTSVQKKSVSLTITDSGQFSFYFFSYRFNCLPPEGCIGLKPALYNIMKNNMTAYMGDYVILQKNHEITNPYWINGNLLFQVGPKTGCGKNYFRNNAVWLLCSMYFNNIVSISALFTLIVYNSYEAFIIHAIYGNREQNQPILWNALFWDSSVCWKRTPVFLWFFLPTTKMPRSCPPHFSFQLCFHPYKREKKRKIFRRTFVILCSRRKWIFNSAPAYE